MKLSQCDTMKSQCSLLDISAVLACGLWLGKNHNAIVAKCNGTLYFQMQNYPNGNIVVILLWRI